MRRRGKPMKVYLAGPDVFCPEPEARGAALKAICAEAGLEGVFPLDGLQGGVPPAWEALPAPRRIALVNEAHISACCAVIANLTPFRGPSADPGAVFEIGFARGLGLPIQAWTADPRLYLERVASIPAFAARPEASGVWRDAHGMQVEDFACIDNLMIDAAVLASGGSIVRAGACEQDGLAAFRECTRALAARLSQLSGG